MTARIFRYEVPVDGRPHVLRLSVSPVLHVACRKAEMVELWVMDCGDPPIERTFQVVGTGHPLPDGWVGHWGTAITPSGQLVWHLLEVAR